MHLTRLALLSAALRGGLACVNSSMSVTGLAPERLQALADTALSGHGRAASQRSKALELRATPDSFEAAARPQIQLALDGLAAGLQP